MNRTDLQNMSELRLQEAQQLLAAGSPSGAYYLAGCALECALKACIAKLTREFDFPDKTRVNESYSHDLAKLLRTAGLENELKRIRSHQPGLGQRWDTAQEWNETSRYANVADHGC